MNVIRLDQTISCASLVWMAPLLANMYQHVLRTVITLHITAIYVTVSYGRELSSICSYKDMSTIPADTDMIAQFDQIQSHLVCLIRCDEIMNCESLVYYVNGSCVLYYTSDGAQSTSSGQQGARKHQQCSKEYGR